MYPFFILSYGIAKKYKGELNIALDSLLKGAELLKNQKNALCESYLYISKIYFQKKQDAIALSYLKKVDSLYKNSPQVIFQARDAYELLLKHYKNTNDVNHQLETVKKLLALDSIIYI